RVPRADLERTLNMGVGFVAVLPRAQADLAVAVCEAHGIPAWVAGDVAAPEDAAPEDGVEVVSGGKGGDGGSVQLVGEHPAT
ncbi:MAG: AIR synthase-related protein, partial [Lapillicoccus sp.]